MFLSLFVFFLLHCHDKLPWICFLLNIMLLRIFFPHLKKTPHFKSGWATINESWLERNLSQVVHTLKSGCLSKMNITASRNQFLSSLLNWKSITDWKLGKISKDDFSVFIHTDTHARFSIKLLCVILSENSVINRKLWLQILNTGLIITNTTERRQRT